MAKISIEIKTGNITNQSVDLMVNSSNTYLLLGSGTAEQIREAGGYISSNDKEYWDLVNEAEPTLRKVLDYIHSKRPVPSIIQKECLEYVIRKNNSKELRIGDSVLTTSGNLAKVPNKARYVAHAVGMTYDWKVQPNPPIIPATFESVRDSLIKSFDIADKLNCQSLAMPVMCTRKGGLTKEESSEATLQALKRLSKDTEINKVIVVLYSEDLERDKEWFQRFYNFI
jgi:O-acetyl-ADP-ribose deacetylase (regulator of RNase III)